MQELFSIFDYEKGKPKIDGFKSFFYWSSSKYADDNKLVWIVSLKDGSIIPYNKTVTNCVCCVKDNDNGELEIYINYKDEVEFQDALEYCERLNR